MKRKETWLAVLALTLAPPTLAARPGEPFLIHGETAADQSEADVAADAAGDFLVVWKETPAAAEGGSRIVVWRSGGGEPFEVAAAGHPSQPAVAALAGGGFVVAWKDEAGIWTRLFAPSDTPAACPETGPRPCQMAVAGAAAGGFDLAADPQGPGFVVVWEETLAGEERSDLCDPVEPPPSGVTLLGRRYDAQGRAACTQRIAAALDGPIAGDTAPPRISSGDELVVTWQQGGTSSDVFIGPFDRDWELPEPPANLFAGGLQRRPVVAAHGDDLAVAWESGPPKVGLDLAICLDGSGSTRGGDSVPSLGLDAAGDFDLDTLRLQLQGVAAALRDVLIVPRDRSLRLALLRFGDDGIETLADCPAIDSTRAAQLADYLGSDAPLPANRFARCDLDPRDDPVCLPDALLARCIDRAAAQLTAAARTENCPGQPAPSSVEPPPPVSPASRQAIVIASDAIPNCRTAAGAITGLAREAAQRARAAGIETLSALRLPASGFVRQCLAPFNVPPESVQRVELDQAVYPATPEGERGFFAKVEDFGDFAGDLGRAIAGELAAEGGVFGRLFAAGEDPPEIQLNSSTAGDQARPDLAVGPAGNTLAAWEDRERERISAQLFNRAGLPLGGELDLSEEGGHPSRPRLAPLPDGRFVAVWERSRATGSREIWGRIVEEPPVWTCRPDATTLCLRDGGFKLTLQWQAPGSAVRRARAARLGPDLGYFWISGPADAVLLVEIEASGTGAVLQAVGLTNLGLALTVTDTRTGAAARYVTPPGHLFPPLRDERSFADDGSPLPDGAATHKLRSERGGPTIFYPAAPRPGPAAAPPAGEGCAAGPETLCLAGGRFRVTAARRSAGGAEPGRAVALTPEPLAGYFSFAGDLDAVVKVVDRCAEDGHFWAVAAGFSSTTVTLAVADTAGGGTRSLLAGGGVHPRLSRLPFACP